jgi:hypothetical protein
MNNQIHTENGAMSDVSGNPVSDDWCSTGTLAVVLGVKASTLSVWLANNRQWLAPYRRVLRFRPETIKLMERSFRHALAVDCQKVSR